MYLKSQKCLSEEQSCPFRCMLLSLFLPCCHVHVGFGLRYTGRGLPFGAGNPRYSSQQEIKQGITIGLV